MALKGFDDLSLLLSSALVESPPPTLKEGNFIKSEYDFSLKEAKQMKTKQHLIIKLRRKYIN